MSIVALATYLPTWRGPGGAAVAGRDEDVVTMAVAAARALGSLHGVSRVALVSAQPAMVLGDTRAVLARALDLEGVPVEQHLGAGTAALEALLAAGPDTLVIAADEGPPAGAAAVLTGAEGATLDAPVRHVAHLPVETRPVGGPRRSYPDARLARELATRPSLSVAGAADPGSVWVAGAGVSRLAGGAHVVDEGGGAHGPLFALAALAGSAPAGRLVAIDGNGGIGVDVEVGGLRLAEVAREPLDLPPAQVDTSVEIPLSLAAYDRAFEAKVGLLGSRCRCGAVEHPPRRVCASCGEGGAAALFPLPRTGQVYSVVTVRTSVPGMATPYSLAIVELEGGEVRVLAPVTDAVPGNTPIGTPGRLVLRRIAVRSGIPDYGYGFQPEVSA